MAVSREEIIEALKEMSLLEASELVKDIEDTFGVSAAAPVCSPQEHRTDCSFPDLLPRQPARQPHQETGFPASSPDNNPLHP